MKLSVIAAAAMLLAVPTERSAYAQTSSAAQSRPSDQQLTNIIATKIANDKSLSADAVKVTVEGGVVTLSGMVGKDSDKVTAEQLARVPGVERVENKLVSREKATDATKGAAGAVADATKTAAEAVADTSKKGAKKTKEAVSKTGEVITDGWISSRIKTKFMGDDTLQASSIQVDTKDHVVTLTGAVPTSAARTKAIALAKEVEGVNRVVDKLTVVSQDPR